MMTQSAFNALLLTLEEPPAHAIFIMATTNVESVPITILSRCQRFNFKKIDLETIKMQLSKICQEENINITDEALEEIAYLSEGGLRDALSLLDQLASESNDITLDKILKNYGSISSLFIKNIIQHLEDNDAEKILLDIEELENSSSDYKVFIKKLVHELINKAIYIKQNCVNSSLSYEDIKNLIMDLNDCFNKISIHINPYLLIQIILLNYVKHKNCEKDNVLIEKEGLDSEDNVLEPVLDNEEDELSTFNEELGESLEELKKIRVNNCFVNAQKSILNDYQDKLNKADVKKFDNLQSLLIDTNIVAAGSEYLVLSMPLVSTANLINHHLEKVESELSTIFGNKVKVIALSDEEWLKYKNEYIQNIKNGVKYKMIDESELHNFKEPVNNSQLENFAKQIFDNEKIEII